MRSDIRLDFNNMMSEAVGAEGLTRADIEELRPQTSQIHLGLQELKKLGQLPFLDLPFQEDHLRLVLNRAREAASRFDRALVLGIGGSALGPRFLVNALEAQKGLAVSICDSLDSEAWSKIVEAVDLKKTLLVVISKSGKTLETWSAFLYFFERIQKILGDKAWNHIAVITDSREGPLHLIAEKKGAWRFQIPAGVGGRFSVLSPVGLFPGALAGVDVDELLAGARRMEERCRTDDPWLNPALMSAVLHHQFGARRKRNIRVLLSYGEGLRDYAPWFAQLWAESLGKGGAGSTPVCSLGPQDQHSQLQLYLDGPSDKVVTLVGVEEASRDEKIPTFPEWAGDDASLLEKRGVHDLLTASRRATEEALREQQRPNQTLLLKRRDAYALGQLVMMAEIETVYAGQLLNVNPFDQPAVERIKRNVREFLSGRITPSRSRNYMI